MFKKRINEICIVQKWNQKCAFGKKGFVIKKSLIYDTFDSLNEF